VVTAADALEAQTPGTPGAPAAVSRPDSLRALVLDRLREQAAPPPAADTTDTAQAPPAVVVVDDGAPPQGFAGVPGGGDAPGVGPGGAALPLGGDSIMQALLDLPGFNSATYRADRADFDAADRRLVLSGTAESRAFFSGRGVRVEADSSITYADRAGQVRTQGPTDLTSDGAEPLRSEVLIYDLNDERATALGAETTYSEGAQWIVRGDLDSIEENILFGSSASFTTCDLPDPHSHFQAAELKVVGENVLVARSVRMYVEDVPVLWLPFMAQNLGRGRASGVLTPVFSINDVVRTSSGYNRRVSNVGYYWAMSDYSDATIALDWFSSNYTALQGGLRYRWANQFLNGGLNVKRFWRETSNEYAFDTNHSWEMSERTSLRASARYVSAESLVRENSFDPREAVSTVDSDGSLNRRFDWGRLTLGSSSKQYLNEDGRQDLTLPAASLSLSTITLFGAPPQTARWYNNVAISGSTSWDRRLEYRAAQPDSAFTFFRADKELTEGSAQGSIGLADLSLNANVRTDESLFKRVPEALFVPGAIPADSLHRDFESGGITWNVGLGYRVGLIGSTTLTPSVGWEGALIRVDSIPQAREYVGGPTRFRAGARLQTDVYGFYPGFGSFEAIRHKVTPSVDWTYAPEVMHTELQDLVFGRGASRTQNVLTFGFNQTFEARVSEEAMPAVPADPAAAPLGTPDPGAPVPDAAAPGAVPPDAVAPDAVAPDAVVGAVADTALGGVPTVADSAAAGDGLRRLPPSRTVTLLGLQTSAVAYDLIRADSTGHFVDGFTTLSISNRVSSSYLQGLDLSFTHDLFDDSERAEGGVRKFAPHLSQLSLSFSVNDQSGLVQAIRRLFGVAPEPVTPPVQPDPTAPVIPSTELLPDDPLGQVTGFDSDRIIPGQDDQFGPARREGWQASVNYSLSRPRDFGSALGPAFETGSLRAQMLQGQFSFAPSENWTVDWSTSYDIELRTFNDHVVSLRRDLHEWEARFGFLQTATGNWSFQFEVALRANEDLRFDYRQRSLETTSPF
jgi:hypothetical protein